MSTKKMKYAAKHLKEADYPHSYGSTYGVILATVIFILFPTCCAYSTMTFLVRKILKEKDRKLMLEMYLPELKNST